MIEFTVPTIPIAQPRQRHAMIAGHMRNYTPTTHAVNDFKATVRMLAAEHYAGPILDEPLRLRLHFVMPRTKAQIWKTKPMPAMWHAKKPDLDNMIKSVKDALSGVLWRDDSLICDLFARKTIASGDERPHCVIQIVRCEDVKYSPGNERRQ